MKRIIYYIIILFGLSGIGGICYTHQDWIKGLVKLKSEGVETYDNNEVTDVEKRTKDNDMPETPLLINRIAQQSRLYTAEYRIHKIVTHEDLLKLKGQLFGIDFEHRFNIGDRRIAIPIEVTLKAYVDFSTFSEYNVEQRGSFIHITLPDPKIVLTASKVDHQGIKQFTSLWRSAYTDEEMTEFTHQGVESVLAEVPNMRLLHTARDCAAQTLIPLLTSLGYQEDHIIITFREGYDTKRIEGLESLKQIKHEIH